MQACGCGDIDCEARTQLNGNTCTEDDLGGGFNPIASLSHTHTHTHTHTHHVTLVLAGMRLLFVLTAPPPAGSPFREAVSRPPFHPRALHELRLSDPDPAARGRVAIGVASALCATSSEWGGRAWVGRGGVGEEGWAWVGRGEE